MTLPEMLTWAMQWAPNPRDFFLGEKGVKDHPLQHVWPYLKPLLALGSSHACRRAVVVFAGVTLEPWLLHITSSEECCSALRSLGGKKTLLVMRLWWSFTFLLSEKQHEAQL